MIAEWKRTDKELPSESGRYWIWNVLDVVEAYFNPSTGKWTGHYGEEYTPKYWDNPPGPPEISEIETERKDGNDQTSSERGQ